MQAEAGNSADSRSGKRVWVLGKLEGASGYGGWLVSAVKLR